MNLFISQSILEGYYFCYYLISVLYFYRKKGVEEKEVLVCFGFVLCGFLEMMGQVVYIDFESVYFLWIFSFLVL